MHCSLAMFLHVILFFFFVHITKAFVHNNLVFPRIERKKIHAALKHHHLIINDIKSAPIYLNRVVIMMYFFTAHDNKKIRRRL